MSTKQEIKAGNVNIVATWTAEASPQLADLQILPNGIVKAEDLTAVLEALTKIEVDRILQVEGKKRAEAKERAMEEAKTQGPKLLPRVVLP